MKSGETVGLVLGLLVLATVGVVVGLLVYKRHYRGDNARNKPERYEVELGGVELSDLNDRETIFSAGKRLTFDERQGSKFKNPLHAQSELDVPVHPATPALPAPVSLPARTTTPLPEPTLKDKLRRLSSARKKLELKGGNRRISVEKKKKTSFGQSKAL